MSYVRAIEGDTNARVLDPAFPSPVMAPSVARRMRTIGIQPAPVPSVNRPQMFSFPRPANPTAITDLRGQQMVAVAVAPAVRHQGSIISAQRTAVLREQQQQRRKFLEARKKSRQTGMSGLGDNIAMLRREAAALTARGLSKPTARLLAAATRSESRGMTGLGDQPLLTTEPTPVLKPEIVTQMEAAAAQQAVLAQRLLATGVLTGQDAATFRMLPQISQLLAVRAAQAATAAGPSWFEQEAIAGVPNVALAAGVGLLVVVLSTTGKKRR